MPFDLIQWQPTFRSAIFWSRYYGMEHQLPGLADDSDPPGDVIDLEFADAPTLRISLGAGVNLGIFPNEDPAGLVELGWEDGCHGHPHVFRWSECLSLSRYIAQHVFHENFPGTAVLLLAQFSPITLHEQEGALPVLREAFDTNGIERCVTEVIANSCVMPYEDFRWSRCPDGRYECVGEGAASLRLCDNPSFPFGMLEAILTEASTAPS